MQAFKILKIPIKERIFVIPLYLQGYFERLAIHRKFFDVIYFMGDALSFYPINYLLDFKFCLRPTQVIKSVPKSLSSSGLTASRADNFRYRYAKIFKSCLKLPNCIREISGKDCFRMGEKGQFKPSLRQPF